MYAILLLSCVNSTVPEQSTPAARSVPVTAVAPAVASSADDPTGSWYVEWDRSATGWSPPHFNGVLVLGKDSVALTFQESGATFELDSVSVEPSTFSIHAHIPTPAPVPGAVDNKDLPTGPTPIYIRGFVDDDRLLAFMRWGDEGGRTVAWSPLTGKRAMLSTPPAPMASAGR